jgi:hypothetical protein
MASAQEILCAVNRLLSIFVTRTRGPFWSILPATVLFWAVVGTQVVATLVAKMGATLGVFVLPILKSELIPDSRRFGETSPERMGGGCSGS